jgi:hypothetical protein
VTCDRLCGLHLAGLLRLGFELRGANLLGLDLDLYTQPFVLLLLQQDQTT